MVMRESLKFGNISLIYIYLHFMKKFSLLFIALFACMAINANEPHKVFCELVGTQKFLSAKCTVNIDMGQNPYENSKLVDEKGKKITFNSMVDAMNYMGKLGWKFEQAYVITVSGQNVYHWLLSKEILDESEASEGLTTKSQFEKQKDENN